MFHVTKHKAGNFLYDEVTLNNNGPLLPPSGHILYCDKQLPN